MSYDLGTAHGKITLEYDGDREAEKADDDINRIRRSSKDADNDLKKFGKTLGNVFGTIGKGAAVTGLVVGLANGVVQAGALGVQLLGIVPVLAQIGTLAAALPALIVTSIAAVGILKAAFAGVGDALKEALSGDLEKFNEALEKLSPQAKEFAIAFRNIVPALKAVQQGIQDAFFANNLQDLFPALVRGMRSLVPTLNQISTQFGGAARQVLRFATSGETISLLRGALNLLQRSLINLTPAIQPVLQALRDVGRVGLEFLEPMSLRVAELAQNFANWLSTAANGGQLLGWMQEAVGTLATLRDIVLLFGDALIGVLGIAEETGGGLLGTLKTLAQTANDFVDSFEGQEAIRGIFTGLLETARQLAPVITTLASAVGSALGPALARLATKVGPLLVDTVNRLAPALVPVAEALADLLIAVAPLVPAVAQVAAVLATVLGGAVASLSRELGPLIELFGGALAQAWETLMPLAQKLATQVLPLAAEAGIKLAEAFAPLVPVIVKFAQTIVDSLMPHLPELQRMLSEQLVPAIAQFAEILANEGVKALNQLIPLIPILVEALVLLLPLFLTSFTMVLRLVGALVQLAGWIRALPGMIIGLTVALVQLIGRALAVAWSAVVAFGSQLLGFFRDLPGNIISLLAKLPSLLQRLFTDTFNRVLFTIGVSIGLIVFSITKLPGMILGALASLAGLLAGLFKAAWNGAVAIVSNAIATILRNAHAFPGRVRSAISNLGSLIAGVARAAWSALTNQFTSGIARAISLAKSLSGRVRSAVGNLRNVLYNAGRDLIQGLINGMQALLDRAIGIARSAASKIKDGIASVLRFGSPSKVMIQYGEWTVEGLIVGMKNLLGDLSKTAGMLANTAIAPTATTVLSPSGVPFTVSVPTPRPPSDSQDPRVLGPYVIQVGDKTLVEIVIDTITGQPKVVSSAAKEGDRQNSWANSGR